MFALIHGALTQFMSNLCKSIIYVYNFFWDKGILFHRRSVSHKRADWIQDFQVFHLLFHTDRLSERLLPGVPEGEHLQLLLLPVSVS